MIDRLAGRIAGARRLTILTGAGVSAASGVPTFRGPGGLWKHHRPEDLATPEAFARDPGLVWEWYLWRRERIAACVPNAAHAVIAQWSRAGVTGVRPPADAADGVRPPAGSDPRPPGSDPCGKVDVAVLTQNVDDLHVRAGTDALVRLHGSIWELSCWRGCQEGATPWRDERVPLPEVPPRCPHCGGLARPAVVWFGESLRPADVTAAVAAATTCDVFLTVGTSSVVYPAASLVQQAAAHGAFTAEINMEATPASARVDVAIHAPAEEALPAINAALASPRR